MKSKKPISLILRLVLVLTLFTGCNINSLIQLRLNKGDSYKVTQLTTQKISMSIDGKNTDMDQNSSTGYIYNITDVDNNGTTTIKVKYDSLTQKQTMAGTIIQYDSKKDSGKTDPQSLAFNSIIGQEFYIKVAKDGKVTSVEGIDQMLENVFSKITVVDAKIRDSLVQTFKGNFGNDATKESLNKMMDIYPGKEVKVGDSWENDVTMNSGFPMKISSDMHLKEIKNGVVSIDVKSKIDANDSGKALDIAGIKIKYKISGEQTGSYKIDKSNGFIQNGELTQTLKGTEDIEFDGQNTSIPVNIESKITYTSEKQK